MNNYLEITLGFYTTFLSFFLFKVEINLTFLYRNYVFIRLLLYDISRFFYFYKQMSISLNSKIGASIPTYYFFLSRYLSLLR